MRLKGSSYFLIVILVIMLSAIIYSFLGMKYFESKLLPIVIGCAIFILAGIELTKDIRALRKADTTATKVKTSVGDTMVDQRRYMLAGAWVVSFVLAIWLLGFVIAIFIFIVSYMKSHGGRWLGSVTTAIITTGIVYGLFEVALGVFLYKGLLFEWLGY